MITELILIWLISRLTPDYTHGTLVLISFRPVLLSPVSQETMCR